MSWQVGALVVGVAGSVAAPPRVRGWAAASAVAFAALVLGIVPWSTFTDTLDALASPLVFLLVAVPLAVLLDEVGFFASLAASFGGTRRPAPRALGIRGRGHGAVQPRRGGRAAHTLVHPHRASSW